MSATTSTHYYTVKGFCAAFCISRSFFYKLLAAGEGPPIFKLGSKTLVPIEEAERWAWQRGCIVHPRPQPVPPKGPRSYKRNVFAQRGS